MWSYFVTTYPQFNPPSELSMKVAPYGLVIGIIGYLQIPMYNGWKLYDSIILSVMILLIAFASYSFKKNVALVNSSQEDQQSSILLSTPMKVYCVAIAVGIFTHISEAIRRGWRPLDSVFVVTCVLLLASTIYFTAQSPNAPLDNKVNNNGKCLSEALGLVSVPIAGLDLSTLSKSPGRLGSYLLIGLIIAWIIILLLFFPGFTLFSRASDDSHETKLRWTATSVSRIGGVLLLICSGFSDKISRGWSWASLIALVIDGFAIIAVFWAYPYESQISEDNTK